MDAAELDRNTGGRCAAPPRQAEGVGRRSTVLIPLLVLAASTCARAGAAPPCVGVDCAGHGTCVMTAEGDPLCACDPGYRNTSSLVCEVDTYPGVEASVDAAGLDRGVAADAAAPPDASSGVDSAAADAANPADALTPDATAGGPDSAIADAASPADALAPDATADRPDSAVADAASPTDAPAPDATADGTDSAVADAASPADALAPDAATGDDGGAPTIGTWVYIAGGTFPMGCSIGDSDCVDNELPQHTVTVDDFYMLETEVTQGQYLAVMGVNPSAFYDPSGDPCGLDCPVETVSWNDASAFCAAIGGRLPSEAEWEYADRAGSTSPYMCGVSWSCLGSYAWHFGNSNTGGGRQPHTVATKQPNAFGLYDMDGNVWEWVEDCWHDDYTSAPSTGGVWAGGDCSKRVLRGCSWFNGARYIRVSYRAQDSPDYVSDSVGLRCARSGG